MKTTVFLTLPCLVLFTLLMVGGCQQSSCSSCDDHSTCPSCDHEEKPTPDHQHNEEPHSHATAGSHGGEMYVIGNDTAHAELKHDHQTGQITVWVSDHGGEPENAGESITLQIFEDGKFVDYPLPKTDTPGMYQLTDTKLCDLLEDSEHLKARLHVTIHDKKATAVIEHQHH